MKRKIVRSVISAVVLTASLIISIRLTRTFIDLYFSDPNEQIAPTLIAVFGSTILNVALIVGMLLGIKFILNKFRRR